MMTLSKKNFLAAALLGVLVVLTLFKVLPSGPSNKATSQSPSAKAALNTKSKSVQEAPEGWAHRAAKSLRERSSGDFAQEIREADSDTLVEISSAILLSHRDEPAQTLAWLEELSHALASLEAHGQAARLLNLLAEFEETPGIESEVFSDWVLGGSDEVFRFFREFAEQDEVPHRQLSLVASLFQGQHAELFETYLSWIEESDLKLKGPLVETLVPHLLPENIDSITEIILANLDHRDFEVALYQLVEVRSPEDPAQNLEWLAELDLGEAQVGTQVAAFGSAIQSLARSDIDAAAQIMSQEDFLPKYFPAPPEELVNEEGNWSGKARWFFDEVLRYFIEEIRETDYELAQNSAESYFDPLRREEYQAIFSEENEATE